MVVVSKDPVPGGERQIMPVPLRRAHLAQALALSTRLNWPYRFEDWAFALDLGHGLAVELDGRLAGTALWWPYGQDIASVGMVIVSPDAQGRGVGGALMKALLAQTAGRRVILNSTQAGYSLYERLGFQPVGMVHQHQAVLAVAPPLAGQDDLRPMRPEDRDAVLRLDREASGMERSALIDALSGPGRFTVIERDGQVRGFACQRVWGRGVVIGPVVAQGQEDARLLIAALAAGKQGSFVRLDVTARSGLSPWLETIGLPKVDAVTAMVLGDAPKSGATQLFALSNQSLG